MGFKSSYADPDVWLRPEVNLSGKKMYSYIMVYVDDLLIISQEPNVYMKLISENFRLKPESIGEPNIYLGTNICKRSLDGEGNFWAMGSQKYVDAAVNTVEKQMKEDGVMFTSKARQPFSTLAYRPELDDSILCESDQIRYFQNLIGMLRWAIEIGRVDIQFEVSCLSRYLMQPRMGHVQQALNVFNYLKHHNRSFILYDTRKIEINWTTNNIEGSPWERASAMKELYTDAVEDLPSNAPEPRGKSVQINCFVDADHAGDKITRRSQTGILIYLNQTPIIWFSKKQNTVESSTFGSEFVALRIATEK